MTQFRFFNEQKKNENKKILEKKDTKPLLLDVIFRNTNSMYASVKKRGEYIYTPLWTLIRLTTIIIIIKYDWMCIVGCNNNIIITMHDDAIMYYNNKK